MLIHARTHWLWLDSRSTTTKEQTLSTCTSWTVAITPSSARSTDTTGCGPTSRRGFSTSPPDSRPVLCVCVCVCVCVFVCLGLVGVGLILVAHGSRGSNAVQRCTRWLPGNTSPGSTLLLTWAGRRPGCGSHDHNPSHGPVPHLPARVHDDARRQDPYRWQVELFLVASKRPRRHSAVEQPPPVCHMLAAFRVVWDDYYSASLCPCVYLPLSCTFRGSDGGGVYVRAWGE